MKISVRVSSAWQQLPRPARVGTVVAITVIALNLTLALLDAAGGDGEVSGPRSSSFSTEADGTAALAELLSDEGFETARSRTRPDVALGEGDTLFVLDPFGVHAPDARALRSFVDRGGRLVLGGEIDAQALATIVESPPTWSTGGPSTSAVTVPLAEVAGVTSVEGEGAGWWSRVEVGVPLLQGEQRPTLLALEQGRGRVLLLADPSPLHNRWIGNTDAGALGVGLAGTPGSRVVFAEAFHGYADEGLGAVPSDWLWLIGALSLATLVFMWSRSRRLGPVDGISEKPRPPRVAYVDAVATSVAAAADRIDSIQGLQTKARTVLASRLGIRPDTNEAVFRRAASRAGLEGHVIDALWRRPMDDADVLEVGRAVAATIRGKT
ncbi:MAG: DUF4350 domain-containing protein [Actinomycetota bacterium]